MERDDDNEYHGEMLDTVRPTPYRERYLAFMREIFTEGSWLNSLPRLHGDDWGIVPQRQINQLPAALREQGAVCREKTRSEANFVPRKNKVKRVKCMRIRTLFGCYSSSDESSSNSNSGTTSESVS